MANPLMNMKSISKATSPAISPIENMGMIKQAAQSIKKMMGMLNGVSNPQQALMMAAQQNPQLNSVMQFVGGRDPQQVFYEQCKKMGLNPEDILKELR